jgi:hypothetical protein
VPNCGRAHQGKSVTLAHVLREGAKLDLDDLLEKLPKLDRPLANLSGYLRGI